MLLEKLQWKGSLAVIANYFRAKFCWCTEFSELSITVVANIVAAAQLVWLSADIADETLTIDGNNCEDK